MAKPWELGDKKTYTGVVRRQVIDKGSENEREVIVLDTGNGQPLPLVLKAGRPGPKPEFDAYVGERVFIEGIEGSGVLMLLVDSVKDITVNDGQPGRPSFPKGPRP